MLMREIIVSKLALSELKQITDCIGAKFSLKRREEFIDKLKSAFIMIQNNPASFPKSEIT